MKKILFLFIVLSLTNSCKFKDLSFNYPDNPDYARKSRAGRFFSGDLAFFGKKKEASQQLYTLSPLASSNLWHASLEIVGTLVPIIIIDSDSGAIVSEWYHENPNERIKIHVLVKGVEIKKENLQIMIFRQKRIVIKKDKDIIDGGWEVPSREDSDAGSIAAKLLQEKILEKAQQAK